jgi:hypothetical protein
MAHEELCAAAPSPHGRRIDLGDGGDPVGIPRHGADGRYCPLEIIHPYLALSNQFACLNSGSVQGQREVDL